jgi:hypothetical protein
MPALRGEWVLRRKQKIKRLLVEEAGGRCAVCGYDRCIINLTFHHVDPARKSFGLSMDTTKALAAYREEMRKCVLVCANCHGEIEAGLVPSPAAGSTFDDLHPSAELELTHARLGEGGLRGTGAGRARGSRRV